MDQSIYNTTRAYIKLFSQYNFRRILLIFTNKFDALIKKEIILKNKYLGYFFLSLGYILWLSIADLFLNCVTVVNCDFRNISFNRV